MKYVEPAPAGRGDLADAIASGDGPLIVSTLLGVVMSDPDWHWLQEQCFELLDHREVEVRAAAAISLGHIARLHGRLDRHRAVRSLELLRHAEPALAGRVEDALDDIEMFAK